MAKTKTTFMCSSCGSSLNKWAGQCPDCSEWNTVKEMTFAREPAGRRGGGFSGRSENNVTQLGLVSAGEVLRFSTGLADIDRVLSIEDIDAPTFTSNEDYHHRCIP